MPSAILLVTTYFLFIAFLSDASNVQFTDPFLAYYSVQIRFILNHLPYYFWGFLIGSVIFFVFGKAKRRHLVGAYVHFVKRIGKLILAGSLVSLFLLFVIGVVEINILAILTFINPRLLGVETNTQVIVDRLKRYETTPSVLIGKDQDNILPFTIAVAESGKSSFYGGRVIPYVPGFLTLPGRDMEEGVLLVGNSLIINDVTSTDFQEVSPVLATLMLNKYFPGRINKAYPKIGLMDKREYQDYRKSDFEEKFKKFDEVIAKIHEESESLPASIDDLNTQIAENQTKLDEQNSSREREYSKCINAGYYKSGEFVKINSKEDCQGKVASLDDSIKQTRVEGDVLASELEQTKIKLEQYQALDKVYSSQKVLTQQESGYVSYEFGSFEPPDVIKISLAMRDSPLASADLYELIVHEYLHYLRYNENGKRLTSNFFDEGLTEYFARAIIKKSLGTDTNLGYPVTVRIIGQMTKRIFEGDFAGVYFANDQAGLEKMIDRAYGKNFYKDNIVLLETLQYTSDSKQIIKLANDFMKRIGGQEIKDEDVKTSFSNLK